MSGVAAGNTGALPPAYMEHMVNIAQWFPELLLELGAPSLEDIFEPPATRVTDFADSRIFEVTLHSRPGRHTGSVPAGVAFAAACAVSPPQLQPQRQAPQPVFAALTTGAATASAARPAAASPVLACQGEGLLRRLGQLAEEYESLAARFAGPHAARALPPAPTLLRLPPAPQPKVPCSGTEARSRLGAATDQLAVLVAQVQAAASATVTAPTTVTGLVTSSEPPQGRKVEVCSAAVLPQEAPPALKRAAESCPILGQGASGADNERDTKEKDREREKDTAERTPRSARGDRQSRQGDSEGCVGRSRALSAKRQSLRISITKVKQLQELGEPASPKFVTKPRVWGPPKRPSSLEPPGPSTYVRERCERTLVSGVAL